MKNLVVRLKLRVRLSDGSRPFLDHVLSANGKLKPLYAVVDGKAEHHPEGTKEPTSSGMRKTASASGKLSAPMRSAPSRRSKKKKSLQAKAVGVELAEDVVAKKQTHKGHAADRRASSVY